MVGGPDQVGKLDKEKKHGESDPAITPKDSAKGPQSPSKGDHNGDSDNPDNDKAKKIGRQRKADCVLRGSAFLASGGLFIGPAVCFVFAARFPVHNPWPYFNLPVTSSSSNYLTSAIISDIAFPPTLTIILSIYSCLGTLSWLAVGLAIFSSKSKPLYPVAVNKHMLSIYGLEAVLWCIAYCWLSFTIGTVVLGVWLNHIGVISIDVQVDDTGQKDRLRPGAGMWMTISAFVLYCAVFAYETYSRGMYFIACFNRGHKMRKYIQKRMAKEGATEEACKAFAVDLDKTYNVDYSRNFP